MPSILAGRIIPDSSVEEVPLDGRLALDGRCTVWEGRKGQRDLLVWPPRTTSTEPGAVDLEYRRITVGEELRGRGWRARLGDLPLRDIEGLDGPCGADLDRQVIVIAWIPGGPTEETN